MGSSPDRGNGYRGGRRGPLVPPPRAGENPQSYDPDPPVPYSYGPGWDAEFPPAPGPDLRPLMRPEALGPHGVPAGTDIPGGHDDPHAAGIPGAPDRPGAAGGAPDWLQLADAWPTAAGAGYLDPAHGPVPEAPGSFRRPRKRRRTALLTTATVVAVALLATIAVVLSRHSGGKAGHTPGPAPGGRHATARGSQPARAVSGVLTNPGPVSTAMIFPHAQVVVDGIRFSRVVAVQTRRCASTARGAFATALTSAGCQRVVRATFVDSAKQYAITAGVAQLPGSGAASRAEQSGKFGPDVWFVGLDGPARSGTTAVSRSVGFGYDAVYRQYIVYALATYSNGRNPTSHAGKVRMLKTLSRSFTALAGQPLLAPPK